MLLEDSKIVAKSRMAWRTNDLAEVHPDQFCCCAWHDCNGRGAEKIVPHELPATHDAAKINFFHHHKPTQLAYQSSRTRPLPRSINLWLGHHPHDSGTQAMGDDSGIAGQKMWLDLEGKASEALAPL